MSRNLLGVEMNPVLPAGTLFWDIPTYMDTGGLYTVDQPWRSSMLTDPLGMNHSGVSISYETEPDFQRGHVWSSAKSREYVEFCLRGGKSSRQIFFNCVSKGWTEPLVLVDGLQRLTAVHKFMNNELRAFGLYYKDYKGQPCPLRQARFHISVNNLPTRAHVLQWYLELNAGGVVHSHKEISRVRELLANELLANELLREEADNAV